MNMCIPMSHQRSWFTCLLHIVVSVHPLQEAVLLCTLWHRTIDTVSLFQAQDMQSKCKNTGDVADICVFTPCRLLYYPTVLLKVLYHKIKKVSFSQDMDAT